MISCLDLTSSSIQKDVNVYMKGLELIGCERNVMEIMIIFMGNVDLKFKFKKKTIF